MGLSKIALIVSLVLLLSSASVAKSTDLTGSWESSYKYGPLKEVMIADIQQIGDDILGSFKITSDEGASGIIFGRVEGDMVKAYYLAVGSNGKSDQTLTMTFTDSRIVDQDTLKGKYYVADSDMNYVSGDYEAIRK